MVRSLTRPFLVLAMVMVVGASERVVFIGDSLTAGYGVGEDRAFPALIDARWRDQESDRRAINAGVSGDTTKGVLARLDWLMRAEPDVAVVAIGANDGLRGVPVAIIEENLRRIVTRLRTAGVRVVLAGMRLPPNMGSDYADAFAAVYPAVTEAAEVPLYPFLLAGVAGEAEYNLPDGAHPNPAGHRVIAQGLGAFLDQTLAADPAEAP